MSKEYLIDFQNGAQKIMDFYHQELKNIKTGRVTPSLVENFSVSCYGTMMELVQLATISAPEPNCLLIKPWDQNNLKEINKAMQNNDFNATTMVDGDSVRLKFAPLTEETRLELVKKVKEKMELAKIKLRTLRDKVREENIKLKEEGDISEDEKFRRLEEIDTATKETQDKLKEMADHKEKEIMTL